MRTATVTAKGQVTIPADVRRALQIESGDELFFMVEGERAILVPAHKQSIMAFHGILQVYCWLASQIPPSWLRHCTSFHELLVSNSPISLSPLRSFCLFTSPA